MGPAKPQCTPTEMKVTYFAHNAAYNVTPTPTVQFTVTAGDPNATKQLLA